MNPARDRGRRRRWKTKFEGDRGKELKAQKLILRVLLDSYRTWHAPKAPPFGKFHRKRFACTRMKMMVESILPAFLSDKRVGLGPASLGHSLLHNLHSAERRR
jgi:hypothetical protein